jgi:predicted AlkP superfamily pyrophosphatase or phosphodiesterase
MASRRAERPGSGRAGLARVLASLLCLLAGCSERAPDANPGAGAAGPILLIGVDGVEWDLVLPLRARGQLPHLSALMARGVSGELATLTPTLSPVIWTSIATGKPSAEHGIHHFVRRGPRGGPRLVTSAERRTEALWNMLSDYGRRVAVVGWWITYPVEPVNGVMVAQTNTVAQVDTRAGRQVWKGMLRRGLEGQVHPPERQEEMLATLDEVDGELPQLTARIFGEDTRPQSDLTRRLWDNCQWAFRADATYARIAARLLREQPPYDVLLVYLGGPDVVGHRFWRYMQPDLYQHRPTPEEIASFGGVIEDYYVYVDGIIGELALAAGPEASVVVVSDHGMQPMNRDAPFDPDDPLADVNSASHLRGEPGVFVAAGPLIAPRPIPAEAPLARADLPRIGSVLDITPTLLTLLGIPVGRDMDGIALRELFAEPLRSAAPPEAIATHDSPEFLAARGQAAPVEDPAERERIEQLRELGYLR